MMNTRTLVLGALLLATACSRREAEYIDALPDRDTVLVKIPEAASMNGLRASNGTATSGRGLVGEPADMYTASYYSARNLNTIVVFIIQLLEAITAYPATKVDDHSATWGPFSDKNEPNEHTLVIEKKDSHYEWRISGKHKSEGDDAYVTLAGGAFEPEGDDRGRGWFGLDFESIRSINPAEQGRGTLGFAFAKTDEGVAVLAHYDGPNAEGMNISASYAYGEDTKGQGFVVFQFPGDIDNGKDGKVAQEDVLIRTRWMASGGRADIVAVRGDLGDGVAQGSQCWDDTFVSTFERIDVDGKVIASAGDASTCVFTDAILPIDSELPVESDVKNPYELASPRQ